MGKIRVREPGQTPQYTLLPEGSYDLEIKKVDPNRTDKKDRPQAMIQMEVVGPDHTGKVVTDWFYLTDNAVWRLHNLYEALGIEPEGTGEYDEEGKELVEYDTDDLIGRIFVANVTQRVYAKRDGTKGSSNDFGKEFDVSEHDPYHADVMAARGAAPVTDDDDDEEDEAPPSRVKREEPAAAKPGPQQSAPIPPGRRRRRG